MARPIGTVDRRQRKDGLLSQAVIIRIRSRLMLSRLAGRRRELHAGQYRQNHCPDDPEVAIHRFTLRKTQFRRTTDNDRSPRRAPDVARQGFLSAVREPGRPVANLPCCRSLARNDSDRARTAGTGVVVRRKRTGVNMGGYCGRPQRQETEFQPETPNLVFQRT